MATPSYFQRAADRSPTRAGFSIDGGASVTDEIFVVGGEETDAVLDLLGDVEPYAQGDSKGGALKRTLPKAHPWVPWCYAHTIETMVGLGQSAFSKENLGGTLVSGDEGQLVDVSLDPELELEAPAYADQYWQYPLYQLTVKFTSRDYALLDDSNVTVTTVEAYDEDGTPYTSKYPDGEWLRFTDYEIAPSAELITAQQGQTLFARDFTAIQPVGTSPPHGIPFSGFPRIYLNKSGVKFNWHYVPYSYIESANSYITKHIGKVNQLDWYGWPKGSLLYLGCLVKRYTPPYPAVDPDWDGSTAFSTEKICDVTFLFDYVERTASAVPDFASGASSSNKNFVAAGHNLQPWIGDRKFWCTVYPAPAAVVVSGTAQAGAATTITLASGSSGTDNYYNDMVIRTTGGTGPGQTRTIKSYVGATKVATISTGTTNWSVTPDSTTTYTIFGSAVQAINDVTTWRPTFVSAPFQELFMNPDVV